MKKIICLFLFAGLMCSCAANNANAPNESSLSATASMLETTPTKITTAAEKITTEITTDKVIINTVTENAANNANTPNESSLSATASMLETTPTKITTAAEKITAEITTDKAVVNTVTENAENLSDDEIIELALGALSSSDYIEDYRDYGSYNAVIVPENEDFDSYTSAFERFPVAYEEKYKDNVIEKISENELYSEWINSYTEIRSYISNDSPVELSIERSYRYFFLKNFRKTADGKLKYTGRLTAEDIKQNFDIFNKEIKIARKVSETDDSFIYDFYSVEHIAGDYGLCDRDEERAKLEHKQITVSKSDGVFGEPVIVFRKSIEILGTERHEDVISCH